MIQSSLLLTMGIFSYDRFWGFEMGRIANCFVLSSRTKTDITEIKVNNWIPRPVIRSTTASKYSKANSNLKNLWIDKVNIIWPIWYGFYDYMKYPEIPQKAYEGKFIHVMSFWFLKCPKIRRVSISFPFLSLNLVMSFFSKFPIFPIETGKEFKLKFFEFWGISRKNQNVVTWINSPSHAFWGISRYRPLRRPYIFWPDEIPLRSGRSWVPLNFSPLLFYFITYAKTTSPMPNNIESVHKVIHWLIFFDSDFISIDYFLRFFRGWDFLQPERAKCLEFKESRNMLRLCLEQG